MNTTKITQYEYIRQQVKTNLLYALEKAPETGDVDGAIRLSKFLLKLFKNSCDEIVQLGAESEQDGG